VALLWSLPRLRGPRHRPFRILVATVFFGLVVNAGVLAGLSTVHPRYQSRVVWLVVLLGAVAAFRLRDERRAATPPASDPPQS
jgi:predicted aspartyl protease